jgi:Domain of unknown function (DUF5925)/ATPase family associated with various cellular activities (AAA)
MVKIFDMKTLATKLNEPAPIIVQNLPTTDLDDLFQNVFRTALASRSLRYIRQVDWQSDKAFEAATAADYLRPDDEVLADVRDECDLRLTTQRSGNLIQLFACAKFCRVNVLVAGLDAESVEDCIAQHRALFETSDSSVQPSQPSAEFGFWYLSEKGPEREEKELDVPTWRAIKENYSAKTWEAIDGLLAGFKPAAGGRLLLWHGKPGTGKTFALRALAWEWKEWCQFEYVMDPENLFGSRADYLARLMIDGSESAGEGKKSRWRLLVLEDTGELLSIDAKERAGQGLSRLLNAVDGLLGQGSRVLLLITTNEELGALHPAVTRPGRCASQVEFLPLSSAEAKAWLKARNERQISIVPKEPRTIAELYALLEGRVIPDRTAIGFTAHTGKRSELAP